ASRPSRNSPSARTRPRRTRCSGPTGGAVGRRSPRPRRPDTANRSRGGPVVNRSSDKLSIPVPADPGLGRAVAVHERPIALAISVAALESLRQLLADLLPVRAEALHGGLVERRPGDERPVEHAAPHGEGEAGALGVGLRVGVPGGIGGRVLLEL